jgi:acyl dehydratase
VIDYHVVRNWNFGDIEHNYTVRDTMLYALSVGAGRESSDPNYLRFIYEKELSALPTMATVLGAPGFWWSDARAKIDHLRLVHGEQHIEIISPLPPAARILARHRVESITDKGKEKGALLVLVREIRDRDTSTLFSVNRGVYVLRGDGGFSAISGVSDSPPAPLASIPAEPPQIEVILETRNDQAMLFRLNGDYNPIHADLETAQLAGFPRPILHGLCTFGMANLAVVAHKCGFDPHRIRSVSARFTGPVYPGERLRVEFWNGENGGVHLRAWVDARKSIVLNSGFVTFR